LGQKRGQDLVTDSLMKGFREIGYKYKYNINVGDIHEDDIVYVNASYEALKWAIDAKKNKKIKKLIVGPVMVVSPDEKNSVICDTSIDIVIAPSKWVKDFWVSIKPGIKDKIIVWAVGVDVYPLINQKKNKILLYKKNDDQDLSKKIVDFFDKNNTPCEVIKYGFYTHKKYLKLLDSAKVMICLSESESQGIALCEAWMKDVPTIVWNRGYWSYGGNYWEDNKIGAPYLNEQSGLFFKDFDDFVNKWNVFLSESNTFSPRKYAKINFSNRVIAENFLELVR